MKLFIPITILLMILSGCAKDGLPVNTRFPFKLSSDPVPSEVYLQDGAIKIRLYVNESGNYQPDSYLFSHYILQGRGKLYDSSLTSQYLVNEDYPFPDNPQSMRETWYFKYKPMDTVATAITFIARNTQGATDTLQYNFNIKK